MILHCNIIKNKILQQKFSNSIHKTCRIGMLSMIKNSTMKPYSLISQLCTVTNSLLGDYTYIKKFSSVDNTEIGKFCSIASNVCIGLQEHNHLVSTHPFYMRSEYGNLVDKNTDYDNKNATSIGNDVWVGAGAIILKGVTIGDGAIIGAGSVVTKEVEPYSICVGNPAHIIKKRFDDETIEFLLKSKWWDYNEERLKDLIQKNAFRDIDILKNIIQKEHF